MIIGVSGPSCSGKSTVTKAVATKLGIPLLCLDDYWTNPTERKFQLETPLGVHRIYEFADEYNGEKLAQQAKLYPHIIIEGFCLMAFPEIRSIVDWHFHLDVPWDTLVQRRLSRGRQHKSTVGWQALGQRANELLTGFQRDLKNTTVLDGTRPLTELQEIVIQHIQHKIRC